MLRVANNQKWVAKKGGGNKVSFGGICSFKLMMKQGPMNLNHTKFSGKKGAQNDVINAKSDPKVQYSV